MECLVFAIWCVCAKRYSIILPGAIAVFTAVTIGALLIGYNPYVINTVYYGNPTYPLVGGGEDIMTRNTPAVFESGNRFVNFFKSLLSVGSSEWGLLRGGFSAQEFLKTYTTDTRVNGFGIMTAPMIVLGIILMFNNRASHRWWIAWLAFLAVGFSFEQSWWARYIPFLWTLVIIPVLNYAAERNTVNGPRRKADRLIAYTIFFLALTNALLAAAVSLAARYSYTAYINYIIKTQKQIGKPIKIVNLSYTFRQIFDERGVVYDDLGPEILTADNDNLFTIYDLDGANIVAELPEEDYPKLYAEPENILARLTDFPKRRYTTKEHQ